MNTALQNKIQVLEMIETETVMQPPLACRATWWKNGIDSIIESSDGITNDTHISTYSSDPCIVKKNHFACL